MTTAVTSNTIEPPEISGGREYGPEASRDAAQPSSNGSRLRKSRLTRPDDNGVSNDETAYANTDDCTYETHETYELHEAQETDESEEAQEANENQESTDLANREEVRCLGPRLSIRIDEVILKCGVSDGDVNRPLFLLAHEVRSIEEELNRRFSLDANAQVVRRWEAQNHDQLEDGHDYLAEFLDKLSLVRYPKGRALARAVEIARGLVPPRQTTLLSSDVQLLASLCKVLQQKAGDKPFFLDGRSAAKALGKPHETVASWLRGLHHLGVIRRESRGVRGMASLYSYLDQRGVNTTRR
jgi:hypothetical protein